MKKLIFLSITILVPALAILGFLFYERKQPSIWQVELDKYLTYLNSQPFTLVKVKGWQPAGKPWEFTQELARSSSFNTYGDSTFFATDYTYQPQLETSLDPNTVDNRVELSYPPDQVICILLEFQNKKEMGESSLQLVLAAEHQSYYHTDWIMHAGRLPPAAPHMLQLLARLDCNLSQLLK